jgi:hypothetical protein
MKPRRALIKTVGVITALGVLAIVLAAFFWLQWFNEDAEPAPIFVPSATADLVIARHTFDLPDDFIGQQIHLIYVLPADAPDRELDTNGVIRTSVGAWQRWLADQTGGRTLRVDTYHGELDISFYRLSRPDIDLRAYREYVRDEIEAELIEAGQAEPDKILAVYYDGINDTACASSASPPEKPGILAAVYLNGLPDGAAPCAANPFAPTIDQPGYLEFAMLHEILHAIGFVPACAPNSDGGHHVVDSSTDLMYAGEASWVPSVLDLNHDDYYLHDNPGCLDLDDSGWLMP